MDVRLLFYNFVWKTRGNADDFKQTDLQGVHAFRKNMLKTFLRPLLGKVKTYPQCANIKVRIWK